ncbi:MAG: tetratricopeptide repeat protein [Flavobacteriales bacterium]
MRLIVFLFLLLPFFASSQGSDQQLAVQYFQSGEFDKAALYYEKLYNKNQSDYFYNYYLKCLLELKEFKEAEKLVKKQQKRNQGNLKYFVDLGDVYKQQGDVAKAKKEYDNAIKDLTGDVQQVRNLALTFRDKGELDYALKVYEKGEKLNGGAVKFRADKAEIYNLKGETQLMIEEYLDMLDDNPRDLDRVENILTFAVNMDDPNNARVELLRTEILKRVQKNPDNVAYNELLIWFFQQKGDLNAAFNQVKALDKRRKEDGLRVLNFGDVCANNQQYDLAARAFEYVITEKGKNGNYYIDARIQLVEVLSYKILNQGIYEQNDLITLERLYNESITELGRNSGTVGLMRGYAKLKAFYMHDAKGGTEILYEALQMPGIRPNIEAEMKLELADIALMRGLIWDASLLYSQVEKAFKHEPIGHEAKLRNARISFYTGDFGWAQGQLDVLKASTSKLISNDAMQLSLLITDNLGVDSIPEALLLYAEADLLVFQNRLAEAELKLDTLNKQYTWHGLSDESVFLRYKIAMKRRDYTIAVSHLQNIIDNYGSDILGDDATFKLAELYQFQFNDSEKASELYKKLMFEYPGSLYVVEARKRFRILRGEKIN